MRDMSAFTRCWAGTTAQTECAGITMHVTVEHHWRRLCHKVRFPFGAVVTVGVEAKLDGRRLTCNADVAAAAAQNLEQASKRSGCYKALRDYLLFDESTNQAWKWVLAQEGLLEDPSANFNQADVVRKYRPAIHMLRQKYRGGRNA